MWINEYNEQETMKLLKEEYLQQGRREGNLEGEQRATFEIISKAVAFLKQTLSPSQVLEQIKQMFGLTDEEARKYL